MCNGKDWIIYNQKLAAELMASGCRLKKMRPDREVKTKNVFFFENTEQVRVIVEKYKSKAI
jgi:hypothetical protein